MEKNEVEIAFNILLEEIENVISSLNQQGAQAFQIGNYDMARDVMERGSQMSAFRTKVKDLQKEWNNIFAPISHRKIQKRNKKIVERLKRGLRTPEEEFRIPILQSLVELGGSAQASEVLNKEDFLEEVLPIESYATTVRRKALDFAAKVIHTG